MFRAPVLIALCAATSLVALSACAPVIRNQGYTVLDANPSQATIGTDTQVTMRTKYGSPTAISTFNPNVWYYISQTTDQFGAYRPEVRQRTVVEITFDATSGKVASIKGYGASDGQVIAYSSRETPTIGRQLGILEQLLGTIGGAMLPEQEEDPGNLPGNRR